MITLRLLKARDNLATKAIITSWLCLAAHSLYAYEFRDKQDPFAAPAIEIEPTPQAQPETNLSEPTPVLPQSTTKIFSNLEAAGNIADIVMVGYLGNSERACALVLDADQRSRCLSYGDELFGYRVSAVRSDSIEFVNAAGAEIVRYLGGL